MNDYGERKIDNKREKGRKRERKKIVRERKKIVRERKREIWRKILQGIEGDI